MEATYLLNSGFLVRVGEILLVFDAFDDPTGGRKKERGKKGEEKGEVGEEKEKGDNGKPMIADFSAHTTRYILREDIRENAGAARIPQDKTTWIGCYDAWQDECISVTSFSSTDEGTSFLVEADGKRIFHAGDFNWWDWTGDTEVNRKFAENGFRKQMKRLAGLSCDIAFFPVDGRLGPSMERGAKVFCAETNPRALVAMHSVGYPAWQPSADFFAKGREIPVWSPCTAGERHKFSNFG